MGMAMAIDRKDQAMCLSCGCGRPADQHGSPDNITLDALQRAADAAKISPDEAARNIQKGMEATKAQ